MRIAHAVRADLRPAQGAHHAAAAERRADIVAERADIRPLRAADAQNIVPVRLSEHGELLDRDRTRFARDLAAAAGNLVELFAVDLERRIHRRHLQDVTAKLRQHRLELRAADRTLRAAEHRAGRILRVGRETKAQMCLIALGVVFGKGHRARRAAGKHDQKAGCHRVERAGMSHAPLAEHAAQLCHDVMTRPAGGLIYQ